MKITKIEKQLKRQNRYSIFIDGKYAFSLHEYQLTEVKLKVGDQITKNELEKYATESQFGKAYERTLNYVLIRPRSLKEVHNYLARTYLYPAPKKVLDKQGQWQFKRQTIDKRIVQEINVRVLDRLVDRGYIDDFKFASSWVEFRKLNKKSSTRKLEQELRSKGIDSEIITAVLQDYNLSEKENLKSTVSKKKKLSRYKDNNKLTAYLLRQGFNYEDIKTELNNNS